MAVFLGGKFFGLLGMIFFIPLTSVIYQLLRDMVNNLKYFSQLLYELLIM
jgi:predicted PurR-regulated permease PerM